VAPVAVTTRSGEVESVHHGVAIALAGDGTTVWGAGDASTTVYPRSALKPLQGDAMIRAGLRLPPEELAVACSSHDGEPVHLEMVTRILAGVGLDATALRNTPAFPLSASAAEAVVRAAGGPSALLQNCSGKHAAMIVTSAINGWPVDAYLEPEHPVQQVIARRVDELTGGVVHSGVDGCGAPTALVRLSGMCRAVRELAMEAGEVYEAMTRHPHLVAGGARDDTRVMRAVPGLLVKSGAEGVVVAAHPDGRAVAVKIADGSDRARLPVLKAGLGAIGFDADAVPVPAVLGHGRPVGSTVAIAAELSRGSDACR
jgi:L-asparaginase II